jgi:hypothetical protein
MRAAGRKTALMAMVTCAECHIFPLRKHVETHVWLFFDAGSKSGLRDSSLSCARSRNNLRCCRHSFAFFDKCLGKTLQAIT